MQITRAMEIASDCRATSVIGIRDTGYPRFSVNVSTAKPDTHFL
jgi:hypothetical protein